MKNANGTYHLENNNCTHLAGVIANLLGFEAPYTQGSWPGGQGPNPGDFGEDLVSVGATRTSGSAANNTGSCN